MELWTSESFGESKRRARVRAIELDLWYLADLWGCFELCCAQGVLALQHS